MEGDLAFSFLVLCSFVVRWYVNRKFALQFCRRQTVRCTTPAGETMEELCAFSVYRTPIRILI